MIDIFSDRIYLHGNENHKSGIPCTFPRTVPMQINRSFGFTTTSCSNTFNAFSFSLHFPDIIISNNKLHLLRKFLFHFDLLFFGQCDHIPVPKNRLVSVCLKLQAKFHAVYHILLAYTEFKIFCSFLQIASIPPPISFIHGKEIHSSCCILEYSSSITIRTSFSRCSSTACTFQEHISHPV